MIPRDPPSRVLRNSQERGYRGPGGCPPRFRKPGREPSPKAACDVAEVSRELFSSLLEEDDMGPWPAMKELSRR